MIRASFPNVAAMAEEIVGPAGSATPAAPASAPGDVDMAQDAEVVEEPQQAAYEPPGGEMPMSAGQLAEVTGFSANSIRNMHKRGEIGGWRVGGRWRYLRSEILQSSHRPALGGDVPEE